MFRDWKYLCNIVEDRAAVMDKFDSTDHVEFRACDNLECGSNIIALNRANGPTGASVDSANLADRDSHFAVATATSSEPSFTTITCAISMSSYFQKSSLWQHARMSHWHTMLDSITPPDGLSSKRTLVGNSQGEWHVSRARRSGGRMVLHRAFIRLAGVAYMHWFPLCTASAALGDSVRGLVGLCGVVEPEEFRDKIMHMLETEGQGLVETR
ncbi:hypothetical protein C8R46DRAFT_1298057 [Mycena filopes]|nr:hypothetical protein C8R46DRAFT_1298057 [Mycena filopes]